MAHPYDRRAEDPGGMECEECNVIFVGAEYHRICAVCAGINDPPDEVPSILTGKTPSEEHNEWDALRTAARQPKR